MKIANKKKFIVRILELIVLLATIILTPIAINYATALRGHEAYGGERLIPLIALIIIMTLEEAINEPKRKMERH